MTEELASMIPFLVRAKRQTYAAGTLPGGSSRPSSHDLPYREGDWLYIDTYLGGIHVIGEEAVWLVDRPVWGMNYYGWMLVDEIPEGFSAFLKEALLQVPEQAPYRGPQDFSVGLFAYACRWEGEVGCFRGDESILYKDAVIYRLNSHGGRIS